MGFYLLIGILWGVVWGLIVKSVIENKGYQENWFWWGFFFGIIALIVALTKPDVNTTKAMVELEPEVKQQEKEEIITEGISADRVDIYSAVHIVSWNIQKESDINLVLSVEFVNVSESVISAIMFLAAGFNSFWDKVIVNGRETFDVVEQDMSVKPGEHGNVQMVLPSTDIRKLKIQVKKVCFSDGTITENTASKWIDTKQNPLSAPYLEFVKQKSVQGKFYAMMEEEYWQCVCGFVNTGSVCRSCNMSKLIASEYTMDHIKDTYQKYLKELEAEAEAEERRRVEAEKQAKEEELRKEKEGKKSAKYGIVLGGALVVFAMGAVLFNGWIEEKKYKEEGLIISEAIDNEEYDYAYNLMISSDYYDRLAEEYGEILWKEQRNLDRDFRNKSWLYLTSEEEPVYREGLARGGVCYYVKESDTRNGDTDWLFVYAVLENGDWYSVLSEICSDEYMRVKGPGYDWLDEFEDGALWSNGWLFLSVIDGDGWGGDVKQYAVKYDPKKQKEYEVELVDETDYEFTYAKMKDGNILIVSEEIEEIEEAEKIKFFDVKKGTVMQMYYEEVKEMYDNNVSDNILTVF